jgi:two-component system, cell cycle sensor histidine kinase and response regulator CckA
MSDDVRRQIFEPFYTTKPIGQGTGLGLSTVYGIVKQSDGHIFVESQENEGTLFTIYLPSADTPSPDSTARAVRPEPVAAGRETVLLVEDEDAVRSLARRVLQRSGYTVLEAKDGEEALEIAARQNGGIDLLVTDVVMPRLGGRVLADRLMAQNPALRVLFMSGYTDDAVLRHGDPATGSHFLQKPFTPGALSASARAALDAPR